MHLLLKDTSTFLKGFLFSASIWSKPFYYAQSTGLWDIVLVSFIYLWYILGFEKDTNFLLIILSFCSTLILIGHDLVIMFKIALRPFINNVKSIPFFPEITFNAWCCFFFLASVLWLAKWTPQLNSFVYELHGLCS